MYDSVARRHMLTISRENCLVRFYVQIKSVDLDIKVEDDSEASPVIDPLSTLATARRILAPYTLD